MTVGTDSMEMYGSRLARAHRGAGRIRRAGCVGHARTATCSGQPSTTSHELSYWDRKRIHNLKYYTWVEQQGKTYEEIQAQWYDPDYWTSIQAMVEPIDQLIEAFNERTGLQ